MSESKSSEVSPPSPPKKIKGGALGGVHVGEVDDDVPPSPSLSVGEKAHPQRLEELIRQSTVRSPLSTRMVDVDDSVTVSPSLFNRLLHMKSESFCVVEPSKEPIWVCQRDDPLVDVLRGMQRRNISSVPVVLKDSDRYFASLDLFDICRFVIGHFGVEKFAEGMSIWSVIDAEEEFRGKTVQSIVRYPNTMLNPFHPIRRDFTAFSVVELLAKDDSIHRVPIVTDLTTRLLVNLVTESQVIRWIGDHLDLLGSMATKAVEICRAFHSSPLFCVNETTMALDAFNLMVSQRVQSVAVVDDETKRLRGVLSLRDIKAIHSDGTMCWRLKQTCRNFILKVRQEVESADRRPKRPIYVIPEATIADAVEAIIKNKLHQIYICDSHLQKKPIGIITIKGLLKEMVDAQWEGEGEGETMSQAHEGGKKEKGKKKEK